MHTHIHTHTHARHTHLHIHVPREERRLKDLRLDVRGVVAEGAGGRGGAEAQPPPTRTALPELLRMLDNLGGAW